MISTGRLQGALIMDFDRADSTKGENSIRINEHSNIKEIINVQTGEIINVYKHEIMTGLWARIYDDEVRIKLFSQFRVFFVKRI